MNRPLFPTGTVILTDEDVVQDADRTGAMVVTGGSGVARVTVVDPNNAATVYVDYDNAKRLVAYLTEEFDL